MSSPLGFLLPAAAIGFGQVFFRPQRGFVFGDGSSITAQATVEEVHHDELQITDHPVERGAMISDHMFKRPAEVIIKCGWSNSPSGNPSGILGAAINAISPSIGAAINTINSVAQTFDAAQSILSGNAQDQVSSIYDQLLTMQISGLPFDIFTGKRFYTDMLFKSLSITTDVKNENSMIVTAVCRQVIIVNTTTVNVPINTNAQAQPDKTTPVQNVGTQQLGSAPGFVSP